MRREGGPALSRGSLQLSSRHTFASIKSKADLLPSTRVCRFAAEWFTIPHAVVKFLLLVFCIILVSLILSWESEGSTLSDLTDRTTEINYRNPIYFYLGVAFLTMIYSIGMTVLGCGGFEIPAITQAIITGVYLMIWLVSSAFVSASLDNLNNAKFIRERGINVLYLKIANGLGFVVVGLYTLDILLSFITLQNAHEESLAKKSSDHQMTFTPRNSEFKYPLGRGSYQRRLSTPSSKF